MGDRQGAGDAYSVSMNRVTERARVAGGPVLADGETKDSDHTGHPTGSSAASGLSQSHVEVIDKLTALFETRKDDLDLALMKVIAEGGSPSEWLVGMLRASIPDELRETSPPKPRFLGES